MRSTSRDIISPTLTATSLATAAAITTTMMMMMMMMVVAMMIASAPVLAFAPKTSHHAMHGHSTREQASLSPPWFRRQPLTVPSYSYRRSFHSQRRAIVFTRLSEDCAKALDVAQTHAHALRKDQIDNACLLLGLCQHPGKARSTLERYDLQTKTLLRAYKDMDPSQRTRKKMLSDFKSSQDIPCAISMQTSLHGAGSIAEAMGSTSIGSEHILLSLLEYDESDQGSQTARQQSDAQNHDDIPNEAIRLIHHLNATYQPNAICTFLLDELAKGRDRPARAEPPKAVKMMRKRNPPATASAARADVASKTIEAPTTDELTAEEIGELSTQSATSAPKGSVNRSKINANTKISSGSNGGADKQPSGGQSTAFLDEFGVDMTQQARDGELDVVHGRDTELTNCLRILARRRKNNICLIGEAGVGKTAIAEGLAQLLVSDACPIILRGHRMISTQVAAILAGSKYRGEFEERFRILIEELIQESASRPIILFLDEIHTLIGAGSTEDGGMDASNMLKPYLARGQLQVVGATTITEYNRFISKDPALERRLQPVLIKEPSVEQTIDILKALVPFYASHHRVEFTPQSIEAAAKLSDRYINDRFLPDKAIDVLDEAGALATLSRRDTDVQDPVVDETQITNVISEWSNIPVGKLEMGEMSRLQHLEDNLTRRVKGQERAIRSVAKAIRRARTGIRNPRRPIASFLFCGPTGTGKTELCKTLADTYFGSERDLIRIDCSEYMEKHAVSRLTGPPPGYAGYEEGGQLTEAIRRAPHSVVLFDEMEKAHGDVLNLLLQVMEDGILTDGKGRTVSFKNSVLIMTSNIGSQKVLALVDKSKRKSNAQQTNGGKGGSASSSQTQTQLYTKLTRVVKRELESQMRPEFLNRIDDIIIFQPLLYKELSLIAALMVVEIAARAKYERNVDINVTSELLKQTVQEGSHAASKFGARPMRRAVQRVLEDAISEAVVQGYLMDADVATFDYAQSADPSVPYFVRVTRERDEAFIDIAMEDYARDTLVEGNDDDDDDFDDDFDNDDQISDNDGLVNGSHPSEPSLPSML